MVGNLFIAHNRNENYEDETEHKHQHLHYKVITSRTT